MEKVYAFRYTLPIPFPTFFMKTSVGTIVGWVTAILVAAFNAFAGIMKLLPIAPGAEAEAMMAKLGMTPGMMVPFGVLELVIVILFVVPRTSTVGFVLMIGYLGGALATNLTHGFSQIEVIPIYVLFVLLMISAWFRNPELVARLLKRPMPKA